MEGPQQYGDNGGGGGESGGGDGEATTATEMSTVSQSFMYYQQQHQQHRQQQQQQQQLLATKATIQEHHPSTTYPRHFVQLPPQYQATEAATAAVAIVHEKKHIRYQPIQYQIEYEKQQFRQKNAESCRIKQRKAKGSHKEQISDDTAVSLIAPSLGPPPTIWAIADTTTAAAGGGGMAMSAESSDHHSPIYQAATPPSRSTMHEVKERSGTPSVIIERGCTEVAGGDNGAAATENGLGSGEVANPGGSAKRGRSKHRPLFRRLFHYMRNTLMPNQKKGDQDECEVYELPPRYRPESVSSLCQITRFSEEEVKRLYRGFKAECPSGVVREDTFKIIYSQFFSARANTGNYAHFVFNTLDHDNSGIINFEDFLQTLSILSRGTMEEKLTWTFALYDINGDGLVTREEMTDIVTAIYDMADNRPSLSGALDEHELSDGAAGKILGANASTSLLPMRMDGERIKQKVDQIFQKMDMNQDGVVTLDEFINCCRNDEVITNSMIVFDNIVL